MSQSKKIALVGHFGVGKTSLVRQFVESAFSEDYLVTVGVHIKKKTITINAQEIQLLLWDLEGNTSLNKARKSYLLGTHGFIYVFDVSRPETYENLEDEMEFLSQNFPDAPVCLIGNKADLFTKNFNKDFFKGELFKECFFTSAKTGDGVDNAFESLAVETLLK